MYKHILIPTDGSRSADKALEAGIEFACREKAKVTLFTAVPEYRLPDEAEPPGGSAISLSEHQRMSREKAHAILRPAAERLRAAGVECDTAYSECDRPCEAIIEAAQSRGCDLILMSSRGRHGAGDLGYGSEAHEVLSHSSIPTLVYR